MKQQHLLAAVVGWSLLYGGAWLRGVAGSHSCKFGCNSLHRNVTSYVQRCIYYFIILIIRFVDLYHIDKKYIYFDCA